MSMFKICFTGIIDYLNQAYNLDGLNIVPLILGGDLKTKKYKLTTKDKIVYFIKLQPWQAPTLATEIQGYLTQTGINHIISPLRNNIGKLYTRIGDYNAILYPYIQGHNGTEKKLSKDHWIQFGSIIKQIHSLDLPKDIISTIPRETFSSAHRDKLSLFFTNIETHSPKNDIGIQTTQFLRSKKETLTEIISITTRLALRLKTISATYVLCHSDIHGWNLMIDMQGFLYILDWDTVILAPKERDLMFINAGIWNSGLLALEEETLFYKGYGSTAIDKYAICYYRFERIIQDINEYCDHIFLSDANTKAKVRSLEYIKSNFLKNGTIEKAYEVYNERPC